MESMHNFTPRAQQVLALARKEADRFHHNYVGTEHLLLGLIQLGQGVAVNVLQRMGLDLETVRSAVEKQVGLGPESAVTGSIPFTPRVKKVLVLAAKEARALNHSYVGTEHILLGLLREGEGVAGRVLKSLGVDTESARNEVLTELDPNYTPESMGGMGTGGFGPFGASGASGPSGGGAPGSAAGGALGAGGPEEGGRKDIKTPALKAFGRDLTEMARNGELDPVIGREKEIQRVIQVLCRRTKNNPVLIGEAGVGKTAIVEGLAQEIASGMVPEILADKRVVTLDLAMMVAGTKYRGQFEERIKAIMDEIRKAKNVIVFIDELHTIVGAGAAEGAMDASNIIKPALSRGELQCIGATTLAEYRKFIEKDGALDRRFQSVKVEPPSVKETVIILRGIRPKYEDHHHVSYSDTALEAAAKYADRYITARHLPDKAIDIMDEAGARARILSLHKPPEIEAIAKEIEQTCAEKEKSISEQKFEQAAAFRDQEKQLRIKREDMIVSWKKQREKIHISVDEEQILKVISEWTGIPLNRIEDKESQKLLSLEKELQESIIGQNEATQHIARALRRSRADLKDPKRPIGSFMFLGPTGVGKTYLAKLLAEKMFGDKEALIQIDMSEYMEKFTVSRLIGSPPGYVGHDEGGQLTEAIRRRPYAVVLFDEIEKAHPDVVQLLLQVLEEGRLTDSLGRVIDFRNTIIIMTSNVGADILQKDSTLGFGHGLNPEADSQKIKDRLLDEAKRFFKPEFLNRINEMVFFHSLSQEHMTQIVELELDKLAKRLADQHIELDVQPDAKAFLVQKGYDKKFGARPLRRAVERYLEDALSEEILKGSLKKGIAIRVGVADAQTLKFEQPVLTEGLGKP
jgi:ATP-dependent Clp protease ATP-binding subunit ClpC